MPFHVFGSFFYRLKNAELSIRTKKKGPKPLLLLIVKCLITFIIHQHADGFKVIVFTF